MKKNALKWTKLINNSLLAIIGLLGFTHCSGDSPECMYGTPNADYQISGKVISKSTKTGIPNIQVKVKLDQNYPDSTLIKTNSLGEFTYKKNSFPGTKFNITTQDIDGAENGSYKDGSALVKDIPLSGGGNGWNEGEGKANVTIELDDAK